MANSVLGILACAEMRRSTRIVRAVPMRVTGVDLLGQPFWERTATLDVNSHGCKFPSKQKLRTNSRLTLGVTDRGANRLLHSVQARVVWVQPPEAQQGLFHIAVELEVPGNVWGITMPPGDWLPFLTPRPLQISTVVTGPPATAQAPPASVSEAGPGELFHLETGTSPAQPRACLVGEVQQQNHKMVPEAAAAAVAEEASRLLDELRTQLQDEAKRIIEGMAAPHTDQRLRREAEKQYESQHASAKVLHELGIRKIDPAMREVSDHPAASTTERVKRILEASQRDLAARFVSQLQQQLALPLDQPGLTKPPTLESPRRILKGGPATLARASDSAWTEGNQPMFCTKCGAENPWEAESCWECGKSIFMAKSRQVPSAAISLSPASVTHSHAQPQPENEPLPQGGTSSSPAKENLIQSSRPTHSPDPPGRIAGLEGTDVQAFVGAYRCMTGNQLLALAKDLSSLSETARNALAAELHRRGLKPDRPQASNPERHFKKVCGWLAFFILASIVFSPFLTMTRLVMEYAKVGPYFGRVPGLLVTAILDTVMRVALMCFGIYAGVCLLKIRPNAVRIAKRYLLAYCLCQVAVSLLTLLGSVPEAMEKSGWAVGTLRSIVYVAIWYSYLKKSERVAATYG